eukprot:Polyplicarium_translucidae@DN2537_c0_g1_i1.p2
MFIVNWIWDVLSWMGLPVHKQAKLLFLGLDHAGKTTLLRMLKDNRVDQLVPTMHPHSEELIVGRLRLKTFDLGGHETARRIWKDYFPEVSGIIFIVDAADKTRFNEARDELNALLESQDLSNVPFMVLGNKIDLQAAASEEQLRQALGLFSHVTYGHDRKAESGIRPVELFMCSVVKRMGYAEGFKWLAQFLS